MASRCHATSRGRWVAAPPSAWGRDGELGAATRRRPRRPRVVDGHRWLRVSMHRCVTRLLPPSPFLPLPLSQRAHQRAHLPVPLSPSLSPSSSLSLSQRAHQRAHRRISTFAGAAVACHAPPGRPAVATAGYDDVEQLASAHTADYSSPYLIHFCLYFLS